MLLLKAKFLFLIISSAVALISVQNHQKKVFCYWGTWSHYRKGNGQFRYNDIDGNLCTHLMYAFFGLSEHGEIRILDPNLSLNMSNIQNTINLKDQYPHLKVMASIGGGKANSTIFSIVARNFELRQTFAHNALEFLETYGFDGIDIDWEYPGQKGGDPNIDKTNFVLLLEALSKKIHSTGKEVTIAVSSTKKSVNISYDLLGIQPHVDYILLMTYNFHGVWNRKTGHTSPLYPQSIETSGGGISLATSSSINYFIQSGISPQKIIMGIPLNGHSFVLSDETSNGIGANIDGPGEVGEYTKSVGRLGYYEICSKLNNDGFVRVWDNDSQVPYAYSNDQWISYEDVQSVALKTEYAMHHELGGIMVWSIETDDFRGICGEKNPLLSAISKTFMRARENIVQKR